MSARPAPRADGKYEVTVVSLAMSAAPATTPNPPPAGRKLALLRAERPPLHFYRYLYDAVGAPWLWVERKRLADDSLRAIIHSEEVEIRVLYAAGAPAGFAELDFRHGPDIDLAYFGLAPEFIGAGLGRWFLRETVSEAWRHNPRSLRVNTCNLDHPAALPAYQKAGFAPVSSRVVLFDPRV